MAAADADGSRPESNAGECRPLGGPVGAVRGERPCSPPTPKPPQRGTLAKNPSTLPGTRALLKGLYDGRLASLRPTEPWVVAWSALAATTAPPLVVAQVVAGVAAGCMTVCRHSLSRL